MVMQTTKGCSVMRIGFVVLLLASCCCVQSGLAEGNRSDGVKIVPVPAHVEYRDGVFQLSGATVIHFRGKGSGRPPSLTFLAERLGLSFADQDSSSVPAGRIDVETVRDAGTGSEGYTLDINPGRIRITSRTEAGRLYAVMSLLQLLPPDQVGSVLTENTGMAIPCLKIVDAPRFRWRGMHLDVSRHFMPVAFVKQYIDMIAFHKMNTFHWHLTDDQGWRIEIKAYPLLTSVGAWRIDREDQNWNDRAKQLPGESATYGGFYSQEEIREVVAYAAARSVTIVPEIEMPAHATAALAAYPQFSCTGGPFTVAPGGVWPLTDIFCAGNDSTFVFLQNILTEVISLFPGKYVHLGGDEADKLEWRRCPKCQFRKKHLRLKGEDGLQSYFMKRMERFLAGHGRKMIGWDEILDGGLPARAAVMSWRGMNGGIAAARQRHDVVMTPGEFCYFDFYQGRREFEPQAIGGYTPLSKVYQFEPVPPSLTPAQARHMLGAQANVWAEYIPTPEHVQYMTLPRMAAMAEVLWSPKSSRDWNNFAGRIESQIGRYEALGWNYARSSYLVSIKGGGNAAPGSLTAILSTDLPAPEIRYTLDGTEPAGTSPVYGGPIVIDSTGTVRAASFREGVMLGKVSSQEFLVHGGLGKPIRILFPFEKYTGGGERALVNGLRGTLSFDDGNWQGYHLQDLVAMIDLGTVMPVKKIGISFLQNTPSWIFFPKNVEIGASVDGIVYTTLTSIDVPIARGHEPVSIMTVAFPAGDLQARYVRVISRNVGLAPEWHNGRGQPVWLFADEIIVE
jgi:hexosaminidase